MLETENNFIPWYYCMILKYILNWGVISEQLNNLEQLALVNIGTCTRLKKSNYSHLTCTKICIFLLCSTFVSAFGLFWTTSLQQIWNYQYLHVLPHNQVSERLVPDIAIVKSSEKKSFISTNFSLSLHQ